MNYAPIVLFVYNRPTHTRKTLEALEKNEYASDSNLYIFADGPKAESATKELENISKTREVIASRRWCKKVTIIETNFNKGLADSIISGVTDIVNKYGKIIVLEDDIVTSTGFLAYMNQALDLYYNVDQVFHISAYMHPLPFKLPDLFFYNVNSCWGWATWKRAWDNFIEDINLLNEKLADHPNLVSFDKGQGRAFSEQLAANLTGDLRTWAIRWHASMFIKNGLCLHPGKSLTRNIGFDASGIHCGINESYQNQEIVENVNVKLIPLEESCCVIQYMENRNSSLQTSEIKKRNSIFKRFIIAIKKQLY